MKNPNRMQLKMIFLSIVAVLSLITLIFIFTSGKEKKVENKDEDVQQIVEGQNHQIDEDKMKKIEENYSDNENEKDSDEIIHHDDEIDYEVQYKDELGKDYQSVVAKVEELAKLYVADESALEQWGSFLSNELLEEKKQLLTDGFVKRVVDAEAFPIVPIEEKTLRFEVRVVWTIPSNAKDLGKDTWVMISYDPNEKKVVELTTE